MGGRILVVSPPTLDIINGECRAGGPSLYAGATIGALGWRAEAVGPVGYVTLESARIERSLGVERLGYRVDGPGFVFRLEYEGSSRRVSQVGVPRVIDAGTVLSLAEGYYEAVLISPVYGEEPGILPPLLAGRAGLAAVDVQGYYRVGLEAPGGERLVSISHSGEEEGGGPSSVYVNIVTRGYGTVTIQYRGGVASLRDPRGPRLGDPTGAGDAFTGALLVFLAKGYAVEDAVVEASEVVASVLPDIQSRALIDCGRVNGYSINTF
ncbi:MAG: PfkB family carbohydrate kinase [Desulfurococcales archaeon]|nr:PfkB family carbohydrate kinase [Desulfurococcales archaeon]